jgi:hypothetical protein
MREISSTMVNGEIETLSVVTIRNRLQAPGKVVTWNLQARE